MSDEEHLDSLVEKLNALDLTDEERSALGALLAHDDRPDVEGFSGKNRKVKIHGFGITLPDAQEFNIGMPPTRSEFNIGMPPTRDFNIGMPPTRG